MKLKKCSIYAGSSDFNKGSNPSSPVVLSPENFRI